MRFVMASGLAVVVVNLFGVFSGILEGVFANLARAEDRNKTDSTHEPSPLG